jgi:PIN domain nuclease of toxin-antitoxin system
LAWLSLALDVLRLVPVRGAPVPFRDIFDRMLVAQASVEPMVLLTDDETLRRYGSFVTVG